MSAFFELVKILFVSQYRIKTPDSKKSRVGLIIALIILALCFAPAIVMIVVLTFCLGKVSGGDTGILAFLILVCQGLVLLFGLMAIINTVFNCKDANQLLPLPLRPITIFLAKLSVVYLNEVLTTAAVILVALLPFGIGAGVGVGFYFGLIIALLLIPMLPMLLGTLVAMPAVAIIQKLSKSGIVKIILQAVLFVGVMVLYFAFQSGVSGATGNIDETGFMGTATILVEQLRTMCGVMVYIHPNYTLSSVMVANNFLSAIVSLLITLAENAALIGLVALMSMAFYKHMLTAELEGNKTKTKAKNNLEIKNKSLFKELFITDLKRIFRDNQMGFQAMVGIILLPVLVVAFYFMLSSAGEAVEENLFSNTLVQEIAALVILGYMTMLGVTANALGVYPITRENKSFAIIKSLPIDFNKYLLAKVFLSTFFMIISDFVTCVFVVLFFKIAWYLGIAIVIAMCLLGFGSMCVTTLIDLKSPKLGWSNFNRSLKNSKNSWLAMLVGMLMLIAIFIIAIPFMIWFLGFGGGNVAIAAMWIVLIVCALVYALVCYKIMRCKASEYFQRIEA